MSGGGAAEVLSALRALEGVPMALLERAEKMRRHLASRPCSFGGCRLCERAAIREFEGGALQHEAEHGAILETLRVEADASVSQRPSPALNDVTTPGPCDQAAAVPAAGDGR